MATAFDEALRIAMSLPEVDRRRLVAQLEEGFGSAEIAAMGRPPGLSLDDPEAVRELQRRATAGGEMVSEAAFRAHLAQKHGVR